MSELETKLRLTADGDDLRAEVRVSRRELERFGGQVEAAGKKSGSLARRMSSVARSASTLHGGFRGLTSSVFNLRNAMGGLVGALAVREFVQMSDTATKLESQLRVVTDTADELAEAQERLFDISQASRSGLESTTQLFARLAQAQKSLGATNEELFTFTERVQKLGAISGAGPEELSNATRQLIQGLQSGVVRAEEFNSILENTPEIARAAARGMEGMDGDLGRLRQTMLDGGLDSERFFSAILAGSREVDSQFADLDKTAEQAFTQLNNSLLRSIGLTEGADTASAALVDSVDELRGVVDSPEFREFVDSTLSGIVTGMEVVVSHSEELAVVLGSIAGLKVGAAFGPWGAAIGGLSGALASSIALLEDAEAQSRQSVESMLSDGRRLLNATSKLHEEALSTEIEARRSRAQALEAEQKGLEQLMQVYQHSPENMEIFRQQHQANAVQIGTLREQNDKLVAKLVEMRTAHEDVGRAAGTAAESETEFMEAVKASEEAVKKENEAYQDWLDQQRDLADSFRDLINPFSDYQDQLRTVQRLHELGLLVGKEYAEVQAHIGEQIGKTADETDRAAESNAALTDSTSQVAQIYEDFASDTYRDWVNTWEQISDGTVNSFDDLFESVLGNYKRMLARMAALATANPIIVPVIRATGDMLGVSGSAQDQMLGELGVGDASNLMSGGISYGIGYAANYGAALAGGAGMGQAGMLASQTAAFGAEGAALTGSALGGGGGAVGGLMSGVAAAAPWIAAGLALYAAFGGKEPDDTDLHMMLGDPSKSREDFDSVIGEWHGEFLADDRSVGDAMAVNIRKGDHMSDADAIKAEGAIVDLMEAKFQQLDEVLGFSIDEALGDSALGIHHSDFERMLDKHGVEGSVQLLIGEVFQDLGDRVGGALGDAIDDFDGTRKELGQYIDRLMQSVSSLRSVTDLTGHDLTVDEQIQAAPALVEATGGQEAFNQKSSFFLQNFYSESERMQPVLDRASDRLSEFNAEMGLTGADAIDSKDALRDYVESLDLTTAAGQAAYAAAMQLAPALQTVAAAEERLAGVMAPIDDIIAQDTMSDLDYQIHKIHEWEDAQIEAAKAAGAGQEELLKIRRAADIKEQEAREAAAEERRQEYEASLEAERDAARRHREEMEREAERMAEQWRGILGSLQDFEAQLLVGDLSPMSQREQYREAEAQFADVARRARLGDIDAIEDLQAVSEQYLEESRAYNASSEAYFDDFQRVRDVLDDTESLAERQLRVADQQLGELQMQTVAIQRLGGGRGAGGEDGRGGGGSGPDSGPDRNEWHGSLQPGQTIEEYNASWAARERAIRDRWANTEAIEQLQNKYNPNVETRREAVQWFDENPEYDPHGWASPHVMETGDLPEWLTQHQDRYDAYNDPSAPYVGRPVEDDEPYTRHATGGVARGLALVGEEGPELIHVGSPSRVYPAGDTASLLDTAPVVRAIEQSGKRVVDAVTRQTRAATAGTVELQQELERLRKENAGLRRDLSRARTRERVA